MTSDVDRLKTVNGELCDRINRQFIRIHTLENLLKQWLDADCNACPWCGKWHDKLCEHYNRRQQQCELITKTKQELGNTKDD